MNAPMRITNADRPAELVPIVEIPNPEWQAWKQRGDETAVEPPEWRTLYVNRAGVDGSTLLRFMRESRTNEPGAIYDVLAAAFGDEQMRLLEDARLTVTDLMGIAQRVVQTFTDA